MSAQAAGRLASLRVVFLGTSQFAIPTLRACAAATSVAAVVTQPDRPAGRGRKVTPPPVAVAAQDLGLTLLQPKGLRTESVQNEVRALRPDVIACVAYGRVIPGAVLAMPALAAINLHPSMLPAYRGASPIQSAIADGLRTTGVTVMHLAEELDAGDIILQRAVEIGPEETAGELERRLAEIGAEMMMEAIDLLARGAAPRIPQDPAHATYVGKIEKESGAIEWRCPAHAIVNHVRAMNPWPCAFTTWREGVLKVWRARISRGGGMTGTVIGVDAGGITVAAGDGAVVLTEVQKEGGRLLGAAEFARGHRLQVGERLGHAAAGND